MGSDSDTKEIKKGKNINNFKHQNIQQNTQNQQNVSGQQLNYESSNNGSNIYLNNQILNQPKDGSNFEKIDNISKYNDNELMNML